MRNPEQTIKVTDTMQFAGFMGALTFSNAYKLGNVTSWGDTNCSHYQEYNHVNNNHIQNISEYLISFDGDRYIDIKIKGRVYRYEFD